MWNINQPIIIFQQQKMQWKCTINTRVIDRMIIKQYSKLWMVASSQCLRTDFVCSWQRISYKTFLSQISLFKQLNQGSINCSWPLFTFNIVTEVMNPISLTKKMNFLLFRLSRIFYLTCHFVSFCLSEICL